MQIVIDIDNGTYNNILGGYYGDVYLEKAFHNGTPLPEKHGRLIDADAIKKKYPLMYNDFGMELNNGIHGALDEAPTILEAKRGE